MSNAINIILKKRQRSRVTALAVKEKFTVELPIHPTHPLTQLFNLHSDGNRLESRHCHPRGL